MTGLGVFLKFPEPGKVKTRLAQDVGPHQAAALYEKMLHHVIRNAIVPTHLSTTLFCDPSRDEASYREYFSDLALPIEMQEGRDLGERLVAAFRSLLEKHGRAIIVGTDCLDITPALLEQAAEKLDHEDVVLGPALDGGYYLIGLAKPCEALFDGIAWSTKEVLSQTLQRAKGLSVHLLPRLSDIDTLEDLKARAREKGGRVDGHTILSDLIM